MVPFGGTISGRSLGVELVTVPPVGSVTLSPVAGSPDQTETRTGPAALPYAVPG